MTCLPGGPPAAGRAAATQSARLRQLPGTDPAIGGDHIAVLNGSDVVLLARKTLEELDRVGVAGADAVAISAEWLVGPRAAAAPRSARRRIRSRTAATIGKATQIAAAGPPSQLGRPSVAGRRLAYAFAAAHLNRIFVQRLAGRRPHDRCGVAEDGRFRTRRSTATHCSTSARTAPATSCDCESWAGTATASSAAAEARLWSTALSGDRAYVTVIRGRRARARIVSEKLGG